MKIYGFGYMGELSDWPIDALTFQLNAKFNTDQWHGLIEWREMKWTRVNSVDQDFASFAPYDENLTRYDLHRKYMDDYYTACDSAALVRDEIEYRRNGELLPSGD